MSDITNLEYDKSFFKKGIHPKIDKLQQDITGSVDYMNKVCTTLDKLFKDDNRFNDNTKSKIQLKKNNRDGYYMLLSTRRATMLKTALKGKTFIKIDDDNELKVSDIEFKNNPKTGTKIFIPSVSAKSKNIDDILTELQDILHTYYDKELGTIESKYIDVLKKLSLYISQVDFIKSNAKVSDRYCYTKPVIEQKERSFVKCTKLRHPIIERIKSDIEYIPHDICLGDVDNNEVDGMLIYGINSSGKSSLMKAVGISIILAQAGMYVPAESFAYSPFKSLFARISANDNLFKGLSSFALEMNELNAIMKRTGPNTLVIGDEVCRGTEHPSAMAIVISTLEVLAKSKSLFLFATHLHEIVKYDKIKKLKNVKAFHLTVEYDEQNSRLIFDRKLKEGSGKSVYGVTVAKHIIKDNKFIKSMEDILNTILNRNPKILNDKTSKYNSNIYVNCCEVCKKEFTDSEQFDTHHINNQKDCVNGFVKIKPYIPMNNECNLVVLCKECHIKVHNDKLRIDGYLDTSEGKKLNFKFVDNKVNRKKYNSDDIKIISKFKGKPVNKAKRQLLEEYDINISPKTIKEIWQDTY
jgi:DNA mismatch repair protein MutS